MTDIRTLDIAPDRPFEIVPLNTIFPFGKAVPIKRFLEPGPLTPELDPAYHFPDHDTIFCVLGVESKQPVYLVGPSGCGKTQLVNQIAARLNYNVVAINFDGSLTRSDLIGEFRLQEGTIHFRHGLIPQAFQLPGTIILLDEVDACPPETAFAMQRAVSEEQCLLLHETSEIIHKHPQNVIFATANTTGMGDTSGLYVGGTHVQNFSFLNRFKTTVEMDYITADQEMDVCRHHFPAYVARNEALTKELCQVVTRARDAYKKGVLSQPLTTRDLLSWVGKMDKGLSDIMLTARYSFLNRMRPAEAEAVCQFIFDSIDVTGTADRKFTGKLKKGDL